ncbi:hypothetical protein PSPO01_13590 [Paraphaeosphaeria sporulosa]
MGPAHYNADIGRLRPIKHYLYLLARVVYYVRVLRAEVLLLADNKLAAFLIKQREFLVDGLYSPISEMLSLLAFSKHIIFNNRNTSAAL